MASRTYQDLLTEARELLQDTVSETYRYSDSTLLNHLNRGLQALSRIRPDVFYDLFDANDLNVPEIVDDDDAEAPQYDWETVFQFEGMFYPPLVQYVVGMAEVQEDEFTWDSRAGIMLTQFRNTVLGL